MPRATFSDLPDHGRLWVFPMSRRLSEEESHTLLGEVDAFLDSWAAHGEPLLSARDLHDRHVLLVGVDEDVSAPSGCSIDALVNRLEALGDRFGVTMVEHGPVWYRDGEDVRVVSRADFRALARDGSVGPDTPVFETTLTRVHQLRTAGVERPARDAWHGKAFFREQSPNGQSAG